MKTCPTCNEPLDGGTIRNNRIYCSSACRQKAFKKRNQEDSNDTGPGSDVTKTYKNRIKPKSNGPSSKEIALERYKLDLSHQRKIMAFQEQQKKLALQEKHLKRLAKQQKEELAAAKALKDKEVEKAKLVEANKKAFAPIKRAVHDILMEVIKNGRDALWSTEDLEDLITDISNTKDKLVVYYKGKTSSYLDSFVYSALDELSEELQGFLEDDAYHEGEHVLITFKKSYIRELKLTLERLENEWETV